MREIFLLSETAGNGALLAFAGLIISTIGAATAALYKTQTTTYNRIIEEKNERIKQLEDEINSLRDQERDL